MLTATIPNKVTINLENAVKVRITDNCDYATIDDNQLFWTDYTLQDDGSWIVSYGTSVNMDYCPVCRTFVDHKEKPEDCTPFWSGYVCGDYQRISEAELVEAIHQAYIEGDMVEYTKEWQNIGMEHQPIYHWTTQDSQSNLGDQKFYTAYSSCRERRYEVCRDSYIILTNDLGGEAFRYDPSECSMEEEGYDADLCIFTFLHHSEEVWNSGYTDVYIDEAAKAMMEMSDQLDWGWVAEECYDSEEHSDFVRIYSREFAEKTYIGQNVSFCWTAEALVELLEDETNWSDCKKHEVYMPDPDTVFCKEEAYVVFHNHYKKPHLNLAQTTVIKKQIEKLDKWLAKIDELWERLGVTDATAEPDWNQYEKMLMFRAELSQGIEE